MVPANQTTSAKTHVNMVYEADRERSAYRHLYYAPKQPDEASIERKEAILARIDFWHTTMLYLDTRKIAAKLQEEGYDVGRNWFGHIHTRRGSSPVKTTNNS